MVYIFFQVHIRETQHPSLSLGPSSLRDVRGHDWQVESENIAPGVPHIYFFSPKSTGLGTNHKKF